MHLVLAVEVPLHDLISLDETIELPLQLTVLLSEESLVTVQRLELLPQVMISLDEGLIAVPESFIIAFQSLQNQFEVFQALLCHSKDTFKFLILCDFQILLP